MKLIAIFFFSCFLCLSSSAQRHKIDSLHLLLQNEKADTARIYLLWNLAQLYQVNQPDTALLLAEEAYSLSQKNNYTEGESRSVNQIANAYNRVGNYPKALQYYIRKLKIEEQRKHPENLAIAYMNIATVYLAQEDYRKALDHTYLADSIIVTNKLARLRKFSLLNIGDIYEKFNRLDSAMEFSNRAYMVAQQEGDENITGTALNNLANICLKRGYLDLAIKNYRKALPLLKKTSDEDVMCETYIGLSRAFTKTGKQDSALYYARRAFNLSKEDGFLSRNLQASTILKDYFERNKMLDSAYRYQNEMLVVKDSINSSQRIKEGQLIAFNEQARQQEMKENRIKEAYELKKRRQYIGIGVLIPLLFLFTLYLRNKKVKPRFIEYLGLVSLLMFFEYLTLILHPVVLRVTNHVPLFELIVFSLIATLLTRTHHKIEDWFLRKLSFKRSLENESV